MDKILPILIRLKSPNNMDLCDDFAAIRSIFEYCNNFIKPLHKIEYSGGNELYIEEIVRRMKQHFHSKEYLTEQDTIQPSAQGPLRKITMFLILNANVTYGKHDLSTDDNIIHVLDSMPKLPTYLLVSCIWRLNLQEYFFECITYTPIWFHLPLMDKIVDILKYVDIFDVLFCVEKLICAIYTNIVRSDCEEIAVDSGDESTERNPSELDTYLDYSMDILRHFYVTDAEKMDGWKAEKRDTYIGFVVKHSVDICLHCFDLYINGMDCTEMEYKGPLKIYNILPTTGNTQRKRKKIGTFSPLTDRTLHQINIVLLNSLETNVGNVTISTYLEWAEHDISDQMTLQRSVGEASYRLKELLDGNDCFKHDVSEKITHLTQKPLTESERAQKSTISELIDQIDKLTSDVDPAVADIWITEFLQRGVIVLDNPECLTTLEGQISLLKYKHLNIIMSHIDTMYTRVDHKIEIDESLIDIVLKAFDNVDLKDASKLISQSIELYKVTCPRRVFETIDYSEQLIECFNKRLPLRNHLKLMFQNQGFYFEKLFSEALKSEPQMCFAIDILIKSLPCSSIFVIPNLMQMLNDNIRHLPMNELKMIPDFLLFLLQSNLLQTSELIKGIIYKYICDSLIDGQYTKTYYLISSLQLIGQKALDKLQPYYSPLIVMCGQILESCRWDLKRYTDQLRDIVSITINFVQKLQNSFLPLTATREQLWTYEKTMTLKPMNRYYFQRLGLSPTETPMEFDRFLRPIGFTTATKTEVTTFLCETLVRCTRKEAEWLAKNEILLPYFFNTILVLIEVVGQENQMNSLGCLRHCFTFFNLILKNQIIPSKKDLNEQKELVEQLFNLIKKIQILNIYDELMMHVHETVVELIKKINKIDPTYRPDTEWIDELKECDGKLIFKQKLISSCDG